MATIATGPADAAREIQELDRLFETHARAGDVTALVEGFYADSAVVLAPGNPPINGKPAIVEFWRGMIAAGVTDLSLNTREVSASGDLAYGLGTYRVTLGGEQRGGKYVVIYRRDANGRYKAVVDSFSESS